MKRSKPNYALLGIIVVALGLFGIFFYNQNKSNNPKTETKTTPTSQKEQQAETKIIDRTLATEKTYKAPDQYTVFDVTYPQFKNVSSEFNQKIEDTVNTGIASQKKDSADNWKARYDTRVPGDKITEFPTGSEKFTFSVSWEPAQINGQYISFVLIISGYTGGAHGYQNIISFNYDVKKGQEVALKDLFPNDPNYLKTISNFSIKDLTAQFHQRLNIKTKQDEANFKDSVMPMLLAGAAPEEQNYSVFTFTPKSITLYFTEYQVAPYAMGESKVNFPRK